MREEKKPRVCVALLSYNQGDYIDDAIESLKLQTFQDFEVYLVDDGSDDKKTLEHLKQINYDKITFKKLYKRNVGNAKRRAELYGLISNEFLLDMSSDDVLDSRFLEKTVEFLDKNEDYGAVSVNLRFFVDKIEEFYGTHEYDDKRMTLEDLLARRDLVLGTSLMRKKALDETDLSGGFVRYQDWDRWISMLEAGWKIGLVPEYLFYYRQLPNSLSHSAKIKDEVDTREKILKKHKESYRDNYERVILDMEKWFMEMKEAKDWLDKQYHSLNEEIGRLNREVERLKSERVSLMATKNTNRGIIKRIIDRWR